MTIHLERLGYTQEGKNVSWGETDIMLYALSVGASSDSAHDLTLTTENTLAGSLQALPTFPVILTLKSEASPIWKVGDFPLSSVIHAGQRVLLHRTLPTSGEVSTSSSISGIYDTGKHAVIETTTKLVDATSGEPLADTVSTALILREGGFGGPAQVRHTAGYPDREPDGASSFQSTPNQALLYRLNGDRNPLHSDPEQAKRAGFPGPILHGLCTYGIAARELIRHAFGQDVTAPQSIEARFSGPVTPGAKLVTEWWRSDEPSEVFFRMLANGVVVLDHGRLSIR